MYSKSTKQIRVLLKPLFLLVVFASSFLSANYAFAEEPSNFSNSASSLSLVNGEYTPAKDQFLQSVSGKFDTSSSQLLSPHITEDVSSSNFYALQDVGQDKQKIHQLDSEQGSKIQQATLSGSGTESNPYQIQSIADLQTLRNDVLYYDKHFILMQNLSFTVADYEDTSAGWNPIGNSSHRFSGSFNGNSKAIYNLHINRSTIDYSGIDYSSFFGFSYGNITNLSLQEVTISGNNYVGGLVGFNTGSIINSSVAGAVHGINYVGGLVGVNSGTITNSSASGTVSGTNRVGGLVGDEYGTLTNSSASGTVSGINYVGGLVGASYGNITNSLASGTICGINYVGGLVGASYVNITNSLASGTVNGSFAVGGLVGHNTGTITNSSAFGTICGINYVGELVGFNTGGTITNSLFSGLVTCDPINLTSPSDASYEFSSSDFLLSWTVGNFSNSGAFVLFRNGAEISSGSWLSNSTISTNLVDLAVGVHNFTIHIIDAYSNSVSDTVFVTIQSVTTAITSSPTNIPTSDPTITSISASVGTLWVLLCISLSLIITEVFIRRRHKHLQ